MKRVYIAALGRGEVWAHRSVHPIARATHAFFPRAVEMGPRRLAHVWRPAPRDAPVTSEVIEASPVLHRKAGRIRRAEGSRFCHARSYHGHVEDIRLELHQKLVDAHAAI